eukprot:gb/GECG01007513.1/.p1 GENE.gb/GECG01007513.1/~~gb/GECG01007513.1/.p1  ORF type:complete len:197 (+),score=26.96 gb/GECG01007513.1/:1-591(+)
MWPFNRTASSFSSPEPSSEAPVNTIESKTAGTNNENQNVTSYGGKSPFNALHTGIIPNSFGTSKGEALACHDSNRTHSPSSSTSSVPVSNSSSSSSWSARLPGGAYSSPMDINPEATHGSLEPHNFPPLPSSPNSSRGESMGGCSSPSHSDEEEFWPPRRISERLWSENDDVEETTSTPLGTFYHVLSKCLVAGSI